MFNIGDNVRSTRGKLREYEGTIITANDPSVILVQWHGYRGGHGANSENWYVQEEDLYLARPKRPYEDLINKIIFLETKFKMRTNAYF